jgi:WD40 repeat protein
MDEPGQVNLPGPYGGHPGAVFTVAYSPDGALLASGGWDGTVRLWSPRDGAEDSVLTGHAGPVRAVAFAPDGNLLASCGRDRTIRLWDTTARTSAGVLRGHVGAVLSLAFAPGQSLLASADNEGRIRLWNLLDGSQVGEFPEDVLALAFSPDGRTLASAGRDGRIRLRRWPSGDRALAVIEAHSGSVRSLAYAPGGALLGSAGGDGFVRLWNPVDGGQVGEFPDEARALAFSSNSRVLASAGYQVGVVLRDSADSTRSTLLGEARRAYGLAFAPDGSQLASANDAGDVCLYDLASGAEPISLAGHTCEILSVDCSPDGALVATGDVDGVIRIWESASGALVHRLAAEREWVRSLAFDAASALLAAAIGSRVRVWDVSQGFSPVATLGDGRYDITAVAFATAGSGRSLLVSADDDGQVATWDARAATRAAASGRATSIAVDRGGTMIIGLGGDGPVREWDDGLVRQWDLAFDIPDPRVFSPAVDRPRCVALRPDGQVLAAAGSDGVIRLWNTADASGPTATRPGHDGAVLVLAFSPDGALLASSGDDGMIRLWDGTDGAPYRTLADRAGMVRSLAFAPTGSTLVAVGDDGRINRWNPLSGQPLTSGVRPVRPLPTVPGTRSDEPSRHDLIGVDADVEMLATLITAASTEPPLAVALLGEWGTGKSSVMLQVQDAVGRLSSLARTEAGGSAYASNVCQIRFNAWHYSDDQVWTGLISHLFRELAAATDDNRTPPDPDQVRAERDRLRGDLTDQRQRLARLESPRRRMSRDLAVVRNTVWRNRWPLLLRGLLTAAAMVAIAFQLLSGGLVSILGRAWGPGQAGQRVPEWLASSLAEEVGQARERLAATKDQLVRVDAAVRLSQLLNRQGEADSYGAARGLIGQVHRDLEQLSTDLDQLRKERQATGHPASPPLERIILYVDDLDRCPPARVVQVLAAVHLMLALPLFVVIVAVDPRWLLEALRHHYRDMLTDALGPDKHPATPLDYLDKIFQIPFSVPPLSPANAAGFLTSLLSQEQADKGDLSPAPSTATGPVAAARDDPPGARHRVAREDRPSPEDRPTPARPDGPADLGRRPGLILRAPETQFIARLGPLLSTPRSAKKLVNLYRLVRIGVPEEELPTFIGRSEYQVVQILLAILVGTPDAAPAIFTALRDAAPDSDVVRVVRAADGTAGPRVAEFISDVRPRPPEGATDVPAYQRWCPRLARYSFYTRSLI